VMSTDATVLTSGLEAALLREVRRCYDWQNHVRFSRQLRPAVLAMSDTARRLGQWIPRTRTIELSRPLLVERPWAEVIGVLEHEMAHQFVHEVLKVHDEAAHGRTFRAVCEARGIDARAGGQPVPSAAVAADTERILERIRKLLALAGSSNQHEAETAMRRAHELMLRHNIEHAGASVSDDFEVRQLGEVRQRANGVEADVVGLIGEFFFVKAIRIRTYVAREGRHGHVYEITGTRPNVEMAEHVFGFLLASADRLWRANRDDARVRDGRDRLSYQCGVIRGFRDKLLQERFALRGTGLVWLGDPNLDSVFERRHPRTVVKRRNVRWNEAHVAGRVAGRTVVLHKPVTDGPGRTRHLLRG
jgi:hypothetical protein